MIHIDFTSLVEDNGHINDQMFPVVQAAKNMRIILPEREMMEITSSLFVSEPTNVLGWNQMDICSIATDPFNLHQILDSTVEIPVHGDWTNCGYVLGSYILLDTRFITREADVVTNGIGLTVQITIERVPPYEPKSLVKVVLNMPLKIIHQLDTAEEEMMGWIAEMLDRTGDTEYYELLTGVDNHYVTRIIIGFFSPKNPWQDEGGGDLVGGCWGDEMKRKFPDSLKKVLINTAAKDYNCLFACIHSKEMTYIDAFLSREQRKLLPRELHSLLRKKCGIKHHGMIREDDFYKISNAFKLCFYVYTIEEKEDLDWSREIVLHSTYGPDFYRKCYVLNHDYHYALFGKEIHTRYKHCAICYKWISQKTSEIHHNRCRKCRYCGKKNSRYHQCAIEVEMPRILRKNSRLTHEIFLCNERIWFADLETFPDLNGVQHVYSAAIVAVENLLDEDNIDMSTVSCSDYYCKFDAFCEHILSLKGTVVFYNGSRFDLFFVFEYLVRNKIEIESYLKDQSSNKIISMKVGDVKFWDMCLFTMGSLKNTCKSFKVPAKYCKKDFDHNKIRSWEDAEEHKEEVCNYNKYDVVSMGIAFNHFAKTVFDLYKFNVIEAVTLSNMAYSIWLNLYVPAQDLTEMKLPNKEEYLFIRRALYGGRCCPQVKYFKSEQAGLLFENVKEHLVYLDVVSLYPYCSTIGEFQMGTCGWRTNDTAIEKLSKVLRKFPSQLFTNDEKNYIRRCVMEVDIICPKNLLTAFLFSRGIRNELEQDLCDKYNQVYDGGTILEALRLGYTVTKVHKYIVFSALGNNLKEYMEHAFTQKDSVPKDSCEYAIHKYLMNGLTGKFSQMLIEGDWKIFYDDVELARLNSIGELLKFEWINNEYDEPLGYAAQVFNEKAKPNKMCQIGVGILATSRTIMSYYLDFLGGYTDANSALYYGDTDSLVIQNDAYCKAKARDVDGAFFGSALGRLKDEYPKGKIVEAVFLAPKTYCLEILNEDNTRMWHIRAKGVPQNIPHVSVHEYYDSLDKNLPENMVEDLKTLSYTLVDENDGFLASRSVLNMPFFKAMISNKCKVIVTYGTLKRRLHSKETGGLPSQVTLITGLKRTINQVWWWGTGKRTDTENISEISFPKGHDYY